MNAQIKKVTCFKCGTVVPQYIFPPPIFQFACRCSDWMTVPCVFHRRYREVTYRDSFND